MNIELFLTILFILLGGVILIDNFLYKKIKLPSFLVENARLYFPVVLFVLFFRSFIVEPFRIPSGSLKPTLLVGDFVLVNKFSYGLRLPVLDTLIYENGKPKRGDIVVFRAPPEPQTDYIKRIVGLPGDHLSYINKVLYINGKPAPQQTETSIVESDLPPVLLKQENLEGVNHYIYQRVDVPSQDFYDVVVPPKKYFAMGDNRDESRDSRSWGFVPESNLAGKAFMVWFSWNNENYRVRWNRIGKKII